MEYDPNDAVENVFGSNETYRKNSYTQRCPDWREGIERMNTLLSMHEKKTAQVHRYCLKWYMENRRCSTE